jgi:hypothetical protein
MLYGENNNIIFCNENSNIFIINNKNSNNKNTSITSAVSSTDIRCLILKNLRLFSDTIGSCFDLIVYFYSNLSINIYNNITFTPLNNSIDKCINSSNDIINSINDSSLDFIKRDYLDIIDKFNNIKLILSNFKSSIRLVDSFDYLESFIQYLSIIINNYTTVILYFITGDDTIKNFINYFNNLIDSLASYMQLLKEPITDYYSNNNISNSGNLLEVNSILICLTNIKNLNNTYTDSNLNILLEKCINISNSTIDLINNLITPLKTVLSNSSSNNTKQIVKTYFLGFYGVLKNLSNIYDNYGFQLINSVFKSQFSNLTC